AGFSIAFDCGAGYDVPSPATIASCPTTNDGVRTVRAKVNDKDGGVSEYSSVVTILNVAPIIAPFDGATLLPGETFSASSSFRDPGADVWTASVNYGDETSGALSLVGKTFALSHTYQSGGSFTVTVG